LAFLSRIGNLSLQQNSQPIAISEPQRAEAFLVAVFEKLISSPANTDTPEGRQRVQPIITLGNRLSGPYRTYAPDLAPSLHVSFGPMRMRGLPLNSELAAAIRPSPLPKRSFMKNESLIS